MTNPRELALNASRWGQAMKKDIPADVGWILIFFPKHEPGKCALVANINEREMRDQVGALQKRWGDHPRIIIPGGD